MTPPPMTIRSLGILGSERAPVELIMIFSSKGRLGKGVGSDPVAMMVFLAVIVSLFPSNPVTSLNATCLTLCFCR